MSKLHWNFMKSLNFNQNFYTCDNALKCPFIIRVNYKSDKMFVIYDFRLGGNSPDFDYWGYTKISKHISLNSAKRAVNKFIKKENKL